MTSADVVLIGHRGALAVEPENTMRSFHRAVAAGVDIVELDLRVTADGALVVMHDETVDRTTDGVGAVAELSLAEVRGLDAGAGEQVPTFAEVLEAVPSPLQVEIKEIAAVHRAKELLERSGRAAEMTITSNLPHVLEEVRVVAPELRRGLILPVLSGDPVEGARAVGAELVCIQLDDMTPELRGRCADAGLELNVWIVNDSAALSRAAELAADDVSTDDPDLVAALLREARSSAVLDAGGGGGR